MYGDSGDRVRAGFFSWYSGYQAPSDFIDPLFTCGAFQPDSGLNINVPEFCDPQIGSQAGQALALAQSDPAAAAGRWAAIDREVVDEALWVSPCNPRTLTVLAARVGSYQLHPTGAS